MTKDIILITGCSGRIGTRAAERFCDQFQVVGFDIVPPKKMVRNQKFYNVDLSSDSSVRSAFERVRQECGNRIASVIHLAAYYSFTGEHPELYDTITVGGTERILRGIQGFEVEQFIFSSTMLVYKPCKIDERIDENWPVEPKWDYPLSKVKTENLIHEKRGKMPTVNLRIAGVYDDGCHSIPISNQIKRIYEHSLEARLFPGNLKHGASFLHMDDLIDAIWLCVQKRKELPPETTLVLGEDTTLSYDQLQRKISFLLFGKEMRTFRVPKIIAKIGSWVQNKIPFLPKSFIKPWMIDLADDNYTLNIYRAKSLLGWTPKHSIETTLPKMITDLKADPQGWYKANGLK